MAKTFPLRLEVEEIALGTVLRKLNDMPGIVKLDLDLHHGGQGAGRKALEQAAVKTTNGDRAQMVIKFLMSGPKKISEISQLIGGNKGRAYNIMNTLSKQKLTETDGRGTHKLTRRAEAQLKGGGEAIAMPGSSAVAALPAPKMERGRGGRISPGSGNKVLRSALANGPLTPSILRQQMSELGMSEKSLSGVLLRAKKGGLIKKNGTGYELTPKGQKIELGA